MNECPTDFCYVSSDCQQIACSFVPHGSTLPVLEHNGSKQVLGVQTDIFQIWSGLYFALVNCSYID